MTHGQRKKEEEEERCGRCTDFASVLEFLGVDDAMITHHQEHPWKKVTL